MLNSPHKSAHIFTYSPDCLKPAFVSSSETVWLITWNMQSDQAAIIKPVYVEYECLCETVIKWQLLECLGCDCVSIRYWNVSWITTPFLYKILWPLSSSGGIDCTESMSSFTHLIDDFHYLFHESNPHLGECVQIHSIVGDSTHAPAYISRSIFHSHYMLPLNELSLSYHVAGWGLFHTTVVKGISIRKCDFIL